MHFIFLFFSVALQHMEFPDQGSDLISYDLCAAVAMPDPITYCIGPGNQTCILMLQRCG